MSIPILIIGKSGTGKSASMRNFKKEEIDVINVESKPLPFRNNFDTLDSDNYREIAKAIKNSKKKVVVVDDAGYLLTNSFMRGHASQGGGNGMFNFYNQLADDFWKLITFCKSLCKEKIIYIIMHETKNDFGDIKPKSIGKLLDEKVTIEGMFTIVLRSVYHDGGYFFRTHTDGFDVAKSPINMFTEDEVDNDLKLVDATIREYYGFRKDKNGENDEKKT